MAKAGCAALLLGLVFGSAEGVISPFVGLLPCPAKVSVWSEELAEKFTGPRGFVAGTLVKTPSGYEQIENLKVGDLVLSQDKNGQLVRQKITSTKRVVCDEIVSMQAGKDCVILTSPHQQLFDGKSSHWISAQNAFPERNIRASGEKVGLTIKDWRIYKVQSHLFEISVDQTHNFFVTEYDVLVHNIVPIAVGITFAFGGGTIEFVGVSFAVGVAGAGFFGLCVGRNYSLSTFVKGFGARDSKFLNPILSKPSENFVEKRGSYTFVKKPDKQVIKKPLDQDQEKANLILQILPKKGPRRELAIFNSKAKSLEQLIERESIGQQLSGKIHPADVVMTSRDADLFRVLEDVPSFGLEKDDYIFLRARCKGEGEVFQELRKGRIFNTITRFLHPKSPENTTTFCCADKANISEKIHFKTSIKNLEGCVDNFACREKFIEAPQSTGFALRIESESPNQGAPTERVVFARDVGQLIDEKLAGHVEPIESLTHFDQTAFRATSDIDVLEIKKGEQIKIASLSKDLVPSAGPEDLKKPKNPLINLIDAVRHFRRLKIGPAPACVLKPQKSLGVDEIICGKLGLPIAGPSGCGQPQKSVPDFSHGCGATKVLPTVSAQGCGSAETKAEIKNQGCGPEELDFDGSLVGADFRKGRGSLGGRQGHRNQKDKESKGHCGPKVGNMRELLEKTPLGEKLIGKVEKTKIVKQGQPAYRAKEDIDELEIKKGDYMYIDKKHWNEVEVFKGCDDESLSRNVLSTDGMVDREKSKHAKKRKFGNG